MCNACPLPHDRFKLCERAQRELATEMVDESPIPCDFKVGDRVIYTNDYGVEFENVVFGFTRKPHYVPERPDIEPRFVYVHWDCWWFPARASSLRLKDAPASSV